MPRASATPRACRWAATCSAAPAGKAPTFLVAALKDPIGANLDRIQVVKGWLDAKGELQEKVYDVAWCGDRKPDAKTGKLPPVGNTVDVANATWTNTIGAPELITVWKDPDFDPAQRAFYYVRVIEIPTPRWTAYDAKRFGRSRCRHPMTITNAPTPRRSGTRRTRRAAGRHSPVVGPGPSGPGLAPGVRCVERVLQKPGPVDRDLAVARDGPRRPGDQDALPGVDQVGGLVEAAHVVRARRGRELDLDSPQVVPEVENEVHLVLVARPEKESFGGPVQLGETGQDLLDDEAFPAGAHPGLIE